MADVKLATVQAVLPTTTGTFTVSAPAGFGQPKAIIVTCGAYAGQAVISNGHNFGIGFADGASQLCFCATSQSGGSSTSTSRGMTDQDVYLVYGTGGTTVAAKASFSQWTAEGVELNCTVASGSAWNFDVIFIGGSDVSNAKVNYFTTNNTTSAQDITNVGFNSSMLFTASGVVGTINSTDLFTSITAFGAVLNDGTQKYSTFRTNSNSASGVGASLVSSTHGTGFVASTSGSTSMKLAFSDFDAQGFTVTSTTASSLVYGYLALQFTNSPDIALFDVDIPTSASSYSQNFGFEPTFGLVTLQSGISNTDTRYENNVVGSSFSAISPTVVRSYASTVWVGSNAPTFSDATRAWYPSLLVGSYQGLDVTPQVRSTSHSFTSTGWDFTLDAGPTYAPVKGWGFAVGIGGAPPVGIKEMYIKDGGIFVKYTPYVKVGGTFQEVDAYVLEGGTWKPVHEK